jgi:hypothetical protein
VVFFNGLRHKDHAGCELWAGIGDDEKRVDVGFKRRENFVGFKFTENFGIGERKY